MILKVTMVCVWMFASSFVFASEDMDVYLADMLLIHGSLDQKGQLEALLKDPEYEPKITRIFESRLADVQNLSNTNIDVLIEHYASYPDFDFKFWNLCKICFLRAEALEDIVFLETTMDKILFSPLTLDLLKNIKDSFKSEFRLEIEERIATIQFAREIEENGLMERFSRMRIQEWESFLSSRLVGYPKSKEAVLVSLCMHTLGFLAGDALTEESVDKALEEARILQDEVYTTQDFEQMAIFLKAFILPRKIKS